MDPTEYNVLGNILDTSWGRSSTTQSASVSVKATLLDDDKILLSYGCIITFGEAHERRREMERQAQDSASFLNATIKRIKKEFKDETGRTLKVEQISDDESYDLLSLGQYSGRRDAYYRRKVVLGIK